MSDPSADARSKRQCFTSGQEEMREVREQGTGGRSQKTEALQMQMKLILMMAKIIRSLPRNIICVQEQTQQAIVVVAVFHLYCYYVQDDLRTQLKYRADTSFKVLIPDQVGKGAV